MKAMLCLWLALTFASLAASAEVDQAKTAELAEMHGRIQQVGTDVKKLAAQKAAHVEQLRKLEIQFGEQINTLESIKTEVRLQERKLRDIRDKMALTKKDILAQEAAIEGLVKSAYAMGQKEGLYVLLNQRDSAMSGRMLVYYDYISKARIQKIQEVETELKTLRRLEAENDTESQLLQLALQKKQQETNELQQLKRQREIVLENINRSHANKQSQLAALLRDEKKLAALVASLKKTDDNAEPVQPSKPMIEQSRSFVGTLPPDQANKEKASAKMQATSSFAELQGRLPWPVQGSIVERFGSRRFETTWDGTLIGAREGAAIHAVAAGRVVYADWLRGYGLMIIVDHGRGYMSLYAFNQSLSKSVGEYVKAGDMLASVGRSGGRSNAALYFGIRHKGKAVDPEHWCRKLGKG
jgi:septal ring factor EnvC (AmiA/AmiB activator)